MAALSARMPPPMSLQTGSAPKKVWEDWIQQFEFYELVVELSKKDDNVQVAMFMSAIGQEVLSIYNTFPKETKTDLKSLKEQFKNYFTPKANVTYERFIFNQVVQGASQAFEEFYTDLLTKSQSCEFGTLKDSLIKDRIVIGVYSDSDRGHLLSVDDLTLDAAVKFCRAAEQSRSHLSSLKADPVQVDLVRPRRSQAAVNEPADKMSNRPCGRCGTRHAWKKCPAFDKICHGCKKTGHFLRFCKAKQVSTLNTDATEAEKSENFTVSALSANESAELSWYEDLHFENGFVVTAKLDTGAQCNVLALKNARQAGLKVRPSSVKNIVTYNNSSVKVAGECQGHVEVKSDTHFLKFLVVDGDFQTIISKDTCVKLKLIKRIESISLSEKLIKQEEEFGCIKNFIYDIDLIDNASLEIFPARRIPHAIRDDVKAELDRMQQLGIIVPVRDPTPAVSPMVV
ncbi:hypothetical protein JTE90_005484 [Oedothorax gibbosus]|uniref:Peptidase A2 domain-containing protein n=1 Tax=Oedothorax gibbosus TaxID=931172 RepID=A0AAV6UMJ9_9ARAC|nr:hypothetical protein JTE90_005484 [Oedothorax gibbosus]